MGVEALWQDTRWRCARFARLRFRGAAICTSRSALAQHGDLQRGVRVLLNVAYANADELVAVSTYILKCSAISSTPVRAVDFSSSAVGDGFAGFPLSPRSS